MSKWQMTEILMFGRDRTGVLELHQIISFVFLRVGIRLSNFHGMTSNNASGREYQLHALEVAVTRLSNSPTSCCTVSKSYTL